MTTIMQQFQCDLQPQIPKHLYKYARTSTPKAAWSHRYNAAKKKANRPQPHPLHTGGTFHRRLQPIYTRKNTKFRAPASSPKQSPCNIHAPITLRYTVSRRKPARIYAHGNTRWQQSCSHSNAICNHRFQNTFISTHAQAHPKQLEATITMRQKKRQTDRSRTRRTQEVPFIAACSHFTRKYTKFRAPASSPKQSPCNIHAPITMRYTASRRKPARIYAHGNTRWQQSCSHSNAICNHRFQNTSISTYAQAHPKQLEATVTMRQKKGKPTAAAPAAHRRYLSSPPAAILHRKIQSFVLRLPPQNKAHATFMPPLHCVLKHHVANPHVSTHMATPDDNNHAAIPMRSATTDSKTPL